MEERLRQLIKSLTGFKDWALNMEKSLSFQNNYETLPCSFIHSTHYNEKDYQTHNCSTYRNTNESHQKDMIGSLKEVINY